mgnify:CR=1 FL=1
MTILSIDKVACEAGRCEIGALTWNPDLVMFLQVIIAALIVMMVIGVLSNDV